MAFPFFSSQKGGERGVKSLLHLPLVLDRRTNHLLVKLLHILRKHTDVILSHALRAVTHGF